jgi:fructokinase
MNSFTVVGLGELIWDLLPTGKQLGGAPTNFAYISHLLGSEAVVASRVGDDELGREAIVRLDTVGLVTSSIQIDRHHPTGTVGVSLDAAGEATFKINPNSAWDYLEWNNDWKELATRTDAVCFGTLGQRAQAARETISSFLAHTPADAVRLFDVNLRHSFFTPEMLHGSLRSSSIVKLNDNECGQVARMLDIAADGEIAIARDLIGTYGLDLVAITRGAAGSLIVSSGETFSHSGFNVPVTDTIGAGDAFAAALALACLRDASLAKTSEVANLMGSWLVTQCGATPPRDERVLESVRRILEQ